MSIENSSSNDERFDRLISVLIASVAILVAITALLQNYASNLSDQSIRTAQALAIEATNQEVSGALRFSFDWENAFQTWYEVDLQGVSAEQTGDTVAAERYRSLEEKFVPFTPLLSDYYDPTNKWTDSAGYISELYLVESTRLWELYKAHAAVGRAWGDIANVFVIQITLLSVTLSLYGLSTTLKGRVRWLFVLVGSGIVILCIIWMGLALIWPRPQVSETAIQSYAEGVGLDYQGKHDEAIAAFDQALADKPDYADAMYDRGNAYLSLGDYGHAISDFLAAQQAGLEGVFAQWNLGWTYYLLGNFEEALATNNVILDSDPSVIGMRMNQALTYLAMGNLDRAQQEYESLVEEVERQIAEAHANGKEPSASLWYYMDAASVDLQNLVDQLDGNSRDWTEAPEADLVRGDHKQIKAFARDEIIHLKEVTLALEYTGALPPELDVMNVAPFALGTITGYDEQGFVTEFTEDDDATFPQFTAYVDIQFTYDGPAPTQQILWKVFRDGSEDASYRDLWDPDLSSSDTWYKTVGYNYTNIFVLTPGEYTVELYVDYHLVQTGSFVVLGE